MPRDANGNYTLPGGNPVITGTTIESAWANTTMDDIKQGLTDSLDRFGRGGMAAPFRFIDGTNSAPGMSWASELSTGFYRAGASDMRATVAGVPQMRWTGVGVDVWDSVASAWAALTNAAGANFALLNAANIFTQNQTVAKTVSSWELANASVGATFAARFALNAATANALELSLYDSVGGAWRAKFVAGVTLSNYHNDTHIFNAADTTTAYAVIDTLGISAFNGRELRALAPNNTTLARFKVDNNGAAYWNTGGGATSYQWYLADVLMAQLLPGVGAVTHLLKFNNDGANYAQIQGAAAGGAIRIRTDSSSTNRGLDLGAVDNAGTFTTYIQLGDVIGGQIAFITNLDMYFGKNIRLFDSTNGNGYTLFMPNGGISVSPQFANHGALLWHHDPVFAYGGVFVSTGAAPGTGGTPGQLWLQTET